MNIEGFIKLTNLQLFYQIFIWNAPLLCFKYKYRAMFLERRADRFYSDLIVPKAFDAWRQFTNEEKEKGEQQMQKAAEFFPLWVI